MHTTRNKILLASDLDGTLIADNFDIPLRNLEAIKRLKEMGGYFCIASGRSMLSGRRYIRETEPNAPCLMINGAVIYDFQKEKIIWDNPLNKESLQYVEMIHKQFPEIGIEAFGAKQIYVENLDPYVKQHIKNEGFAYEKCHIHGIKSRLYKILFAMHADKMEEVRSFVDSISYEGVNFVATSKNYFEMIPDSVNKGISFLKLSEIMGIERENTFAIGDYYNDIELLSAAGTGAAAVNAPDDVKQHADIIVGHCNHGAVADFISQIEKRYR